MIGETVTVYLRRDAGKDEFNGPIWETVSQRVENVLIAPGDGLDNKSSARPESTKVRYTLYFPKTFDKSVECLQIEVRGRLLDVVGVPDHYDSINCPTQWWMVVQVGDIHG